jgi:hypothetical protein
MKINFFILNRSPKTFHEHVIIDPTTTIHANPNPCLLKMPDKLFTGELNPLVCIEDLWLGDPKKLVQCLDTEGRIQRRRDLPGQNVTAKPVHDCNQVDEPIEHPNIRNVSTPDLIGTVNHHISQQIRVSLMLLRREAQTRLRINGLQAHQSHQPPDPLNIDRMSLTI